MVIRNNRATRFTYVYPNLETTLVDIYCEDYILLFIFFELCKLRLLHQSHGELYCTTDPLELRHYICLSYGCSLVSQY